MINSKTDKFELNEGVDLTMIDLVTLQTLQDFLSRQLSTF